MTGACLTTATKDFKYFIYLFIWGMCEDIGNMTALRDTRGKPALEMPEDII